MNIWPTTSCSVRCSLAYLRGFWPPGRRFLQVDCWHSSLFHDGWIPGELLATESERSQWRQKGRAPRNQKPDPTSPFMAPGELTTLAIAPAPNPMTSLTANL